MNAKIIWNKQLVAENSIINENYFAAEFAESDTEKILCMIQRAKMQIETAKDAHQNPLEWENFLSGVMRTLNGAEKIIRP